MLRYDKHNLSKDVAIFVLYVVSISIQKKKWKGPDFVKSLEVPEIIKKYIGIHQESLMSCLGIIKTPKIQYNIIKKTRQGKTTTIFYPMEPLWSPKGASRIQLENIRQRVCFH